jgi:hypothetical protein
MGMTLYFTYVMHVKCIHNVLQAHATLFRTTHYQRVLTCMHHAPLVHPLAAPARGLGLRSLLHVSC